LQESKGKAVCFKVGCIGLKVGRNGWADIFVALLYKHGLGFFATWGQVEFGQFARNIRNSVIVNRSLLRQLLKLLIACCMVRCELVFTVKASFGRYNGNKSVVMCHLDASWFYIMGKGIKKKKERER
jgi:hypothetical protein